MSRGIHAAFDKLREIAPGANIWRRLLRVFRETLGVYKGSSHTKVNTSMLVSRVCEKALDWCLSEFADQHVSGRARTVDVLEKGVHDVETMRLPDFHRCRRALLSSRLDVQLSELQDSYTVPHSDNNLGLEALIDKTSVVVEVEEILRSEGFSMSQFFTEDESNTL